MRLLEHSLVVHGFNRLLTEEQLLRFARGCSKGLCLDWIAHFVRPIPKDVLAEKRRADKALLFDNYVILHYDPENRGTTQKDREAAKDPILFGVIKDSRKLYFVGDWKDELCDLTLDQIAEKVTVHDME